jgi:RNA polymerase sigma-70 factor, ECF subfamily
MGGNTEQVQAAQRGDMAAFASLYEEHRELVRRVVSRRLSDRDAVADAVQDTFTKAMERLGSLRDPSRFAAWVSAIARNAAVDHCRRGNRLRPLSAETAEAVPEARPGPEDQAVDAELAALVSRHMNRLPARHARILTLSANAGGASASVAAELGVSPGAARIALFRARNCLRGLLAEHLEMGASPCHVA